MIVLLDLEWIEKDGNHLTQLSALRSDDGWGVQERLDILVRVPPVCCADPAHVAFGGYAAELFQNAGSEEDAVLRLSEWLLDEDRVWVWAESNARVLKELWEKHKILRPVPKIQVAARKTRAIAARKGYTASSPHRILAQMRMEPPYPEHRASNDVEAMRRLFAELGVSAENFPKKEPAACAAVPRERPSRRERNADIVSRVEYNYIYAEGGSVFHRRECRHCLGAKTIHGSVYYETAAEGRRPCKICKPIPNLGLTQTRVQIPPNKPRSDAAVETKLLGGRTELLRPTTVVGWCKYNQHPGALTARILKEHRCLEKQCWHFQKNEEALYWKLREEEARKKEQKKLERQVQKAKENEEAERLRILRETWQSHLDDMESDMYIVRIARETPSSFRIFYVSDNRFADGNRYPDFLETLKFFHPYYHIKLRHIRDVDGHFVTTQEYFSRARK